MKIMHNNETAFKISSHLNKYIRLSIVLDLAKKTFSSKNQLNQPGVIVGMTG